ncbi:MAG: YfhO family protein [Oscillospiraceae bacterium]
MNKNTFSKKSCLYLFASCFLMFLIGISPFLIFTKGAYISKGDYNTQVIPFWQHMYNMYKSGLPAWDWTSDLGMNFLGSYSFYGLTSPYTIISLIFPKWFLPYAITVINGLKFGVAGVSAYIYAGQYVKNEQSAYICGLLYAFSGVQLFDMVYHFTDVISFFPLVLYTFDKLVKERQSAAFAVMLALTGFTNYYFFFGTCVFILIYFIVKVISGEFVIDRKLFCRIAFEAAAGVLMTAAVLLPSYYVLCGNKRAGTSVFDGNLLAYEAPGTIWRILQSMFFIPDPCANGLLFSSYQLDISSISLYIPLFSILGVIGVFRKNKKEWYSRLLAVCGIIAVIPLFNSVFSAFNGNYYARWFYMPLLIMIVMTGKYLDDARDMDTVGGLKLISAAVGLFSAYGIYVIFTTDGYHRSTLVSAIVYAILSISVLYSMFCADEEKTSFISIKNIKAITAVFCVLPFVIDSVNVSSSYNWEYASDFICCNYNDYEEAVIDDDTFFRTVPENDEYSNVSLDWGYPSVNMFHSLIPGSTSDFYSAVGEYRLSNKMKDSENYAIHSFLSVKYELYNNKPLRGGVEVEPEHVKPKRYGFEQYDVQNRYIIFENKNYIPMGFTYDNYLNIGDIEPIVPEDDSTYIDTEEQYEREKLLLKAIWLTDEQIEKYGDILSPLPEELKNDTSDEAYEKDCADRRASAAYEFVPDNNGFTAKIKLEKDNLVFFSVPYDEGFTAYVDGTETEIERVFGGLCAVSVTKGDHTVRFDYTVWGLKEGSAVSIVSAAVLLVYGIVSAVLKKRSHKKA